MKNVRIENETNIVREIIYGPLPPFHIDVAKQFMEVADDVDVREGMVWEANTQKFVPFRYVHDEWQILQYIKGQCQDKIYAILPEFKQINSLARLSYLNSLTERTEQETAELNGILNAWSQIEELRKISNVIEAEYLNTGTITTQWPEWSAPMRHTIQQFIDGEI